MFSHLHTISLPLCQSYSFLSSRSQLPHPHIQEVLPDFLRLAPWCPLRSQEFLWLWGQQVGRKSSRKDVD